MQASKAIKSKMVKAVKPKLLGRNVLLVVVLLCSVSYRAKADLSGGVLSFLRGLEEAVEQRTLWFYRFFGSNLHASKWNLAKDCDYDDPNKIQFCPPAVNPVMYANPNLPGGGGSGKSIPSKCLEDPDDPDCGDLRQLLTNEGFPGMNSLAFNPFATGAGDKFGGGGAPTTTSFVSDYPVESQATQGPTKDWCYGNMKKYHKNSPNGKYCISEMPSVSLEPSQQPTGNERGTVTGNLVPSTNSPEGGEGTPEPGIPDEPTPGQDAFSMPASAGDSDAPSDTPSDVALPRMCPLLVSMVSRCRFRMKEVMLRAILQASPPQAVEDAEDVARMFQLLVLMVSPSRPRMIAAMPRATPLASPPLAVAEEGGAVPANLWLR